MGTGTSSRAAVIVAALVLTTALIVGGGILVGSQVGDSAGSSAVTSGSFSAAVVGPLFLGAWLAWWDPRRSDAARRIARRVRIVVIAFEVLASVVLVWSLAAAGAPVWVGPVMILGVVAATFGAVWVGEFVRRTATPPRPSADVYSRAAASRDVRRVALAAGITFAVALAALLVLAALADLSVWDAVGFAVVAAAFAVSIVCNLVVVRLGRAQRAVFDGDVGRVRRVAKIVLGRRSADDSASDEDLAAAARYASTVWVAIAYQAGASVSLFLSLVLIQVFAFVRTGSTFSLVFVIVCSVIAVAFALLSAVQIRRARRYAREHPVGV